MTVAHRTYQLRGYCTAGGYNRIREVPRQCATLYNTALQERRDAWRMNGRAVLYKDQQEQLKHLRADLTEWEALDALVGRGVLRRAERAFGSFFRRAKTGQTPGYPRFKPRSRYTTIELAEARPEMVKRSLDGKTVIKVKGLPVIRVRPSRELPLTGLKGLKVTLKHGRLLVSLTYAEPTLPLSYSADAVGIDMCVNQQLTLSNGIVIPGRPARPNRVKRLQRAVSRAHRGSKGRRRKVRMLAREMERVALRNRKECHALTTDLVRQYGHIAVEALVIPNMVRTAAGTKEEPGTNVKAKNGPNRSITE